MPGEDSAGEDIGQGVLGVVVAHGDFFQDHLAFDIDVAGRDGGVQHHLADQADRQLRLFGENACVVTGVLVRGEGVELAADRIDGVGDGVAGAVFRALEQQVLEVVRRAGEPWGLVDRTHPDPHTDGGAARPGNALGDHP